MKNQLNLATFSFAIALAVAAPSMSFAQTTSASSAILPTLAQSKMKESKPFSGVEVNGGTVSVMMKDGKTHLMLSPDFKIPKTPAPHWQIKDANGNLYLLNQLKIAGSKENRDITLPSNIKSIASVRIWCSFAEVLLGEATFDQVVKVK